MIDYGTYQELHPGAELVKNHEQLLNKGIKKYRPKDGKADFPEKYLYPGEIPGFNFRTKKWSWFLILILFYMQD